MLTNNSPENILHTAYEAKMISSGDNSPSIKIKGTKLQYLLVMLHLGFESNIMKMVLGWTNEEFEEHINSLEVEGLLKHTGGRYYPTCMVITACEGKKLYNLCEPLIKQTLSRYSTLNLITANNEIFEEYFQNTNTDINYKKKQLVKGFVAADRQIDLHLNVVYEKLGLYQNSQPIILMFKKADVSTLNEIANTISEDLVLLFNENDKPLKEYFVSSRYSKEINYEEFFIWWYHFFYTKVTEELIKQGVIITSTQKNQTYIIY
ncbi:hypothetical protein [Bacillus wiedmannii]|uniref:hypothetical protein n=1 Tax=Bacillus wiedmannii TaxID=1890302 RepID=UPI000B4BC0B0|nr:hypothetical protein [Bacillus wiedmannii]